MNHRKAYISPWVTLLLTAVVALGCMMAAAGVTYARYRSYNAFDRIFSVRESGSVYLGRMEENQFVNGQSAWQTTDGIATLSFAISNGLGNENWSHVNQRVTVRTLVGPGSWENTLTLTVNDSNYVAVATAIPEGSALYKTFGEGWILQFFDEKGDEMTWELSGDAWNCVTMQLSLSATLTDTSLLRLQVIAEEN